MYINIVTSFSQLPSILYDGTEAYSIRILEQNYNELEYIVKKLSKIEYASHDWDNINDYLELAKETIEIIQKNNKTKNIKSLIYNENLLNDENLY